MKSAHNVSRRDFIRLSAGAAAAAGILSSANPLLAAAKPKWPVGCRDVYLKFAGSDCWSSMKALGAEGIEVDVSLDLGYPNLQHGQRKYTLATEDGLCALRDD